MMNWNDLRVEQEIAQERYQRLIRQREVDRLTGSQPSLVQVGLAGLGRQLARWGHWRETRFNPQLCCA
jgi:hypothetical protein